jgi:RHS repeat-associated protein
VIPRTTSESLAVPHNWPQIRRRSRFSPSPSPNASLTPGCNPLESRATPSVTLCNAPLIAEYNETTGALIRECVWNRWEPIAAIEGGTIYYVRADHIGRPVFATNSTGVKVWSATYTPFGGVHTSTGALPTARFPGQWFQSESGLHQNWMRDYDPTTGRYLQADPLGLIDGASVYGYVRQSPMMYTDPTGECPWCVGAAIIALGMLYDYLSDDCYTWTDFWYSLASNINPISCRKMPILCAIRKGGGGGGGGNAGGGGGAAGPSPGGYEPPPSTPVGSRGNEIQVPPGPGNAPTNTPTTIGGRDYSGHALDRMQERGYTPTVVENAISTGTASPGNSPGTTKYHDSVNNVSVIVDSGTGRVVTVRGGP